MPPEVKDSLKPHMDAASQRRLTRAAPERPAAQGSITNGRRTRSFRADPRAAAGRRAGLLRPRRAGVRQPPLDGGGPARRSPASSCSSRCRSACCAGRSTRTTSRCCTSPTIRTPRCRCSTASPRCGARTKARCCCGRSRLSTWRVAVAAFSTQPAGDLRSARARRARRRQRRFPAVHPVDLESVRAPDPGGARTAAT